MPTPDRFASLYDFTNFFLQIQFPIQFSYGPLAPVKRFALVQTHGGVRVHAPPAADNQLPGDQLLAFSIPTSDFSEWSAINARYIVADTTEILTFRGYWGDTHKVKWFTLDNADTAQQYFDITGSFRIVG